MEKSTNRVRANRSVSCSQIQIPNSVRLMSAPLVMRTPPYEPRTFCPPTRMHRKLGPGLALGGNCEEVIKNPSDRASAPRLSREARAPLPHGSRAARCRFPAGSRNRLIQQGSDVSSAREKIATMKNRSADSANRRKRALRTKAVTASAPPDFRDLLKLFNVHQGLDCRQTSSGATPMKPA